MGHAEDEEKKGVEWTGGGANCRTKRGPSFEIREG
jgi:hypothetical protein